MRRPMQALALAATALVLPASASALGWKPAERIGAYSDAGGGGRVTGAFAQPDNRFLIASGKGYATGSVGDPFSLTPFPVVSTDQAGGTVSAVFDPTGAGFVAWQGSGLQVGARAADGTIATSPQRFIAEGDPVLGRDSSGNVTFAYVKHVSQDELHIARRGPGDSAFVDDPTPLAQGASLDIAGLVVDPDGAAVIAWNVDGTLQQSTRSTAAGAFSAPSDLFTSPATGLVKLASNAAGRAALVLYAGGAPFVAPPGTYYAALRSPGGSFSTPISIGSATTAAGNSPGYRPGIAVAVSADGTAGALTQTSKELACFDANNPSYHGLSYALEGHRADAGSSTWASVGTAGGESANSLSQPALAGGPGSRIEAAWAIDKRTEADRCAHGHLGPFAVAVGPMFSVQLPEVYSDDPPAQAGYSGPYDSLGPPLKLAINGCGDGVLIFGVRLFDAQSNPDPEDGVYLSTSQSGTCPAAPGGNPSGGNPPGGNPPGGSPPGGNPPGGSPPADTTAPAFGAAKLTHSVFAVDPKGPAETPAAARVARAARGTSFVYTLSEPARVLFKIERRAAGRRNGKKCVKPSKRNRHKRACTRYLKVGSFGQSGVRGSNTKKFSGRIGKRPLKPGRYRATLTATDASGNKSHVKRLSFRVVRG